MNTQFAWSLLGGVTNAFLGTLAIALVTRFLVDRLSPQHSARLCGLLVALGFAIGRFGINLDPENMRELGGFVGAIAAIGMLWMMEKRSRQRAETTI